MQRSINSENTLSPCEFMLKIKIFSHDNLQICSSTNQFEVHTNTSANNQSLPQNLFSKFCCNCFEQSRCLRRSGYLYNILLICIKNNALRNFHVDSHYHIHNSARCRPKERGHERSCL